MALSFYDEFLRELARLDEFLAARPAASGAVDAEDPDVRRLLEAAAYFSARTRLLATEAASSGLERLAGSYLEPLLTPMPCAALMRADVTEALTEARFLPQGTEVRLTTRGGVVGRFATVRSAAIRPLRMSFEGIDYQRSRGFRLLLRLRGHVPVGQVAEPLRLFVNSLGDYVSSARLLYALWEHLQRVTVVYGERPAPSTVGAECAVTFGDALDPDQDALEHPLARIRAFFHCPAQSLFLNVRMPSPPRPFTDAWLCFDLGDDWPEDIVVREDSFRLHVVPVVNLHRAQAAPVTCDGTRDQFPITNLEGDEALRVRSVKGVYKAGKGGLEPLRPAVFASSRESFEVLQRSIVRGREHLLSLRIPSAFEKPCTVVADVEWYQPDFDRQVEGELSASLQRRKLEGVSWKLQGRVWPHRGSVLEENGFGLLHVLALRAREWLGREELVGLMEMLGACRDSQHGDIGRLVTAVACENVTAPQGNGSVARQRYRLTLAPFDGEKLPLVLDYVTQVGALLEAWGDGPVELAVTVSGPVPRSLQLPGVAA